MFMSGGSRGIGLAIATRVAREGANVALIAKTAEPHPRLPGTIHTAAEEIEAAGGEALPIVGDIRDEDAVDAAVAQTVESFGGIDLVVNNASAINLAPMRRPRGQALRPDAADQRARHVRGHAGVPAAPARVRPRARAHALAAAVGRPALAARPQRLHALEDGHDDAHARRGRRRGRGRRRPPTACGRARSSPPPRSRTCSAATRRWRAPACPRSWPTPPHEILSRDPRECTGNVFIDDEVLAEAGVTDLDRYSGTPDADLVTDIFVEDSVRRDAKADRDQHRAVSTASRVRRRREPLNASTALSSSHA